MRNKNVINISLLLVLALVVSVMVYIFFIDTIKQDNGDKPKDKEIAGLEQKPTVSNNDEENGESKEAEDEPTDEEIPENTDENIEPEPEITKEPEIAEEYQGTGKIFGTVSCEDKSQFVPARVQLLDFGGSITKEAAVVCEVISDEMGEFEFDGIKEGKYKVAAYIDDFGFGTSELIKLRKDEEKLVEILISKGFKLFGVVKSESEELIAGVQINCVLLDSADQNFQAVSCANTNSNDQGEYELNGLNTGAYWIEVTHELYATNRIMVRLQEDTQQDFVLSIGGAIHGIVKNENGELITKFKAKCYLDADDPDADLNRNAIDKVSAEYKTFESETGEFLFTNLMANKYAVEVLAESYAQTPEKGIVVNSDETTEVEIILLSGNTLNGVVLNKETNEPIANAKVSIAETFDLKQDNDVYEYPFMESQELTTSTDDNGKFSISCLPKKLIHVWISHEDYPQVKQQINFAVTVKDEYQFYMIADSSMVYGTVYDSNEQPVEGRYVIVQTNNSIARKMDVSDKNGEYKIEKIAPGEYLIILANNKNEVEQIASFSIKKGEKLEINLGIEEGITVTGKVTSNGKAIKGRSMVFTSIDDNIALKITVIQNDGTYKVVLAKPGRYSVLIQGFKQGSGAVVTRFEIDVPDVMEHEENLEIPTNVLKGKIFSEATNQPIEKCAIFLESMSSKGSQESVAEITKSFSGRGSTNETGEFSINEIAQGKYRLKIVGNTFAVKTIENVDLSAGGEKDLGTIFLKQETRITGFVTDETGAGIPGANLVVSNMDGLSLAGFIPIRSGKDGAYTIGGLSQGKYKILVYADGFSRKVLPSVTVSLENEMNLNITLQKGATLTVYVKDLQGKKLLNAKVTLYNSKGSVNQIFSGLQDLTPLGLTDITGKSFRKSLVPGLYTVEVSKEGYDTQRKKVSLSAGLDSELEFILYNK